MFRRCEPPTFAPPTRGSRAPSSCSDDVRAPGRHRWSDDAARLCRLCLCGLTRLPSLGVFRRRGVCIAFACTRAPPYTLQRAAYTHLDLLAAFLLTHNVIRLACVRQLGLLGVTASTKDDPPPLPPPLPPAPVGPLLKRTLSCHRWGGLGARTWADLSFYREGRGAAHRPHTAVSDFDEQTMSI